MAVTAPLLTYEQYMSEEPTHQRYEIVDGVRVIVNPTRKHQDVLLNIAELFRSYQRRSRVGKTIIAPCDVLIRRNPLRVRQPDVLFISHEQLAKCGEEDDPAPLEAAPELVVEILSPSDYRSALREKIEDYCAAGVKECWIVSPQAETVEVLRLSAEGAETVEIYGISQTLTSVTYPDLTLAVESIFTL